MVDGDTIWCRGEKMRMRNYDTSERGERFICRQERVLPKRATERLHDLLNSGYVTIERHAKENAPWKKKRKLVS